ncbi:MAG: hypothetical protein PHI98_06210 [Eubacteriales bacterium]|nr:hypothetical protein [Eubacteriales bacterium]
MAEGVLTEREWRNRRRSTKRQPPCWGAQCTMVKTPSLSSRRRALHAAMVMISFVIAMALPAAVGKQQEPDQYQILAAEWTAAQPVSARAVNEVEYALPQGIDYVSKTFTREQLLRGKFLLISDGRPLPKGVPAPNTMSVANYGKGMVPVNDLTIKSGKETIAALTRLFAGLRGKGIGGFAVCRGTMTPWEQREWQLERLRTLAARMPMDEAVRKTLAEVDPPGTGELQQEYAVELRLVVSGSSQPDEQLLESTAPGRTLLQTAWRYGFIRTTSEGEGFRAFRFRYVGEAHATAMTFLNLDMEEYLTLLHQKRVLHVKRDATKSYFIFCKPMDGEYVEFQLPEGAALEASFDNDGYAVVACICETPLSN